MDRDDFKGFFNLVLLILFIAAMLLGPLIERWRKKKEEERRRAAGGAADTDLEPPPAPVPPRDQGRPRLPYEHLLEEVFGPYIERRRQAAEEAGRLRVEEIAEEEEDVDADEDIRRMRETRRPPELVVEPVPTPELPEPRMSPPLATAVAPPRRARTLEERIFRNPRLSPGAKLLLAAEILGKPRALRR